MSHIDTLTARYVANRTSSVSGFELHTFCLHFVYSGISINPVFAVYLSLYVVFSVKYRCIQ